MAFTKIQISVISYVNVISETSKKPHTVIT